MIAALLRYAPGSMRVVLISRRELDLGLGSAAAPGASVAITDADLAFTTAEAADALASAGRAEVDPSLAVEVTGGWVAGVLFEAWRSTEHVAGAGGEADALHGYLSSQILDQLSLHEREFLITTSVLDDVTAQRAEALGESDAAATLASLRAKHLPVSWRDGRTCDALPRAGARVSARAPGAARGRGCPPGPGDACRAAAGRGTPRGGRRGDAAGAAAGARARARSARHRARDRPARLRDGRAVAGDAGAAGAGRCRRHGGGGDDARPRARGLRALRARSRSPAHGVRAPAAGPRIPPRSGHDGVELLAPGPLARRPGGRVGGTGQPGDRGGPVYAEPCRPRARGRAADQPDARRAVRSTRW